MMLTRDFWIGFVTGAVTGVVGYRLYEQNQGQLGRLVQSQPFGGGGHQPSVEELMAQKERLEDLIAEQRGT